MKSPRFSIDLPGLCVRFQAKHFANGDEEHARLVKALRKRFPARSDRERAERIAERLNRGGAEVTDRTVQNWLSDTAKPHWRCVPGLFRLLGRNAADGILLGPEDGKE